MVEDVGGFNAELELRLLVEREVLHQREREVGGAGADDAAHGSIAEAADADAAGGLQIEVRKGAGLSHCAVVRWAA
jgi:hypothetical protein